MRSQPNSSFADYHMLDLLRLALSGEMRSHLDGEEMQALIVELATRLEDGYERTANNSI